MQIPVDIFPEFLHKLNPHIYQHLFHSDHLKWHGDQGYFELCGLYAEVLKSRSKMCGQDMKKEGILKFVTNLGFGQFGKLPGPPNCFAKFSPYLRPRGLKSASPPIRPKTLNSLSPC